MPNVLADRGALPHVRLVHVRLAERKQVQRIAAT